MQLGFVGDLIGFSLTEYLTEELLLKPVLGSLGISSCVGVVSSIASTDVDVVGVVKELTLGGASDCMLDVFGSDIDLNGDGRFDLFIEGSPFHPFVLKDVNGKTQVEALITGSEWLVPKGPAPPRICTSFSLLEFREEEGYTTPVSKDDTLFCREASGSFPYGHSLRALELDRAGMEDLAIPLPAPPWTILASYWHHATDVPVPTVLQPIWRIKDSFLQVSKGLSRSRGILLKFTTT